MPKKTVTLDYDRCCPEKCTDGVCLAALECEYGSLKQEAPYELPDLVPAKWCHGCAKCARVCPAKAINVV
ncbi:MAG: hypothetical protein IBX68_01055 [Dehalococcoidia bacterium]|nr:hypothetical protein [Dehalococcoidia bacterium]